VTVNITVHPSAAGTSTRFVHTTAQPPSLVIHDGTTTLVFSPADLAEGLADAAKFAQELVQVASEWESSCRHTQAATQPENRSDVEALATGHAPGTTPDTAMMNRQQQATCTTKTNDHSGGVATGPAPKPARRTALAAARKAAGLTQETLAARVGVERSTVYRWEAGETTPMPMLRPGLAQLLRLDNDRLSALLGEPVSETAPRSSAEKESAAQPTESPVARHLQKPRMSVRILALIRRPKINGSDAREGARAGVSG
jgi:transcriptional regulator with XRE-family HTH domain